MTDKELHKLSKALSRTALGRSSANGQRLDRYVMKPEKE